MSDLTNQLIRAIQIANRVHGTQLDKSGIEYVRHPERVSCLVPHEMRPLAWLHDVLEDGEDMFVGDLIAAGIDADTAEQVFVLTRQAGESYGQFIERICATEDVACITVKLADLRDNLRPGVPERLLPVYTRAIIVLHGALRRLSQPEQLALPLDSSS